MLRLFALAVSLIIAALSPAVAKGGAPMVIHAVVLAVDQPAGLVTLRHEALETVPATTRVCRFRAGTKTRALRRGMVIEAVVETAHRPWIVDSFRVRADPMPSRSVTI